MTTARTRRRPRVGPAILAFVAALAPIAVVGAAESPQVAQGALRVAGELPRIAPEAVTKWGAAKVIPTAWDAPVTSGDRSIYQESIRMAGTLIAVHESRTLLQVYPLLSGISATGTGLLVRNLDTLAVERTITLDFPIARATQYSGPSGDWMYALDGAKRIFFLDANAYQLAEVDLASGAVKKHPFGEPLTFAGRRVNGFHIGGMTYDAKSASLLIYVGGGSSTSAGTYVMKHPLNQQPPPPARRIRACTGPTPAADGGVGETLAVPFLVTDDNIFATCHRSGNTALVVRMPRGSAFEAAGTPPEADMAGPVSIEAVMVDQRSQRIFIATVLGEIWAFDTNAFSFIGVISASAASSHKVYIGFGLDPESGRVFFQSPSYGFGVAEGRFFPIPQARTVPSERAMGSARIIADTKSSRAFVLPGYNQDTRPKAYKIYALDAAPTPPAMSDPDRNTLDVDEETGKTEARYFASGSGYGTRVILAKGVSTVPPAAGAGVQTTGRVINDVVNSKCGYTDREMVSGRVAKAEYDTGSTSAEAIAVGVDERTKLDMERAARCDVRITHPETNAEVFNGIFSTAAGGLLAPADTGPGWDRTPSSCTSSSGGEAQTGVRPDTNDDVADDDDSQPLGKSQVECPLPGKSLLAFAESELSGPVKVGKTRSDVKITAADEKTGRGILSTVTSVAQDIDIAGLLRIGEIRAVATSKSFGRPQKDKMSTHVITIRNVSVAGAQICDVCDPNDLAAQLNTFGLGRVEFRAASGLDERLLTGTPKGASTAVQKSVARQASDRALVGDFIPDVPGFEMIVYNDNTEYGRARQIYQFAGVATAATYNIVATPRFLDDNSLFGSDLDSLGPDDVDSPLLEALTDSDQVLVDSGYVPGAATPAAEIKPLKVRPRFPLGEAILRGIRLFFTSPRHAGLILTGWGLLSLPALLSRRRRLLAAARMA